MRYEKMLDPELCRTATERLLKLLAEYDTGARVISAFTDSYVNKYPVITLKFDRRYVDRYTGIYIPNETIEKTLTGLGFKVSREGDDFTVIVPSFRSTKDVTIKADVIEEITRIYGYDNFDVFTSQSAIMPVRKEILKSDEDRMKDVLVKSYRLHEVHSYIWSDSKKEKELGIETYKNVRIINAQTPDHQQLRYSMIPTLLSFAKENKAYADSFGIFEIGHTVEGLLENGKCNEQKKLGVVLVSRSEGEEALFMKATDIVRELTSDILHLAPSFESREPKFDYEHPKNTFSVKVDGVNIGYISVPHPSVLANIDKKCSVAFLEISTEKFASVKAGKIQYCEPSKFPSIDIDITYNADVSNLDFESLTVLAKGESELLSGVLVKDIYNAEGVCALTLRYTFSSNERTLTKQELQAETDRISEKLAGLGLSVKM